MWNCWALRSKERNDTLAGDNGLYLYQTLNKGAIPRNDHKSPVIFHRYSQWVVSCPTRTDGGEDNWSSKLNAGFLQLVFHSCMCRCFHVCVSIRTIHSHSIGKATKRSRLRLTAVQGARGMCVKSTAVPNKHALFIQTQHNFNPSLTHKSAH